MPAIMLSDAALALLRRRLAGEGVEVTDDTRPLYLELVAAGLMMPLHTFALGPNSAYRLTDAACELAERGQLLRLHHLRAAMQGEAPLARVDAVHPAVRQVASAEARQGLLQRAQQRERLGLIPPDIARLVIEFIVNRHQLYSYMPKASSTIQLKTTRKPSRAPA